MSQASKLNLLLLCGLWAAMGCRAAGDQQVKDEGGAPSSVLIPPPAPLFPPSSHFPDSPILRASAQVPDPATLAGAGPPLPLPQSDDRPLPINLPTALKLANVRAVDVAAAGERVQAAAADLERARALWLPSITLGGDYYYHSGPIQDVSNAIFNDNHNSLMVGAGSGIGPAAVLTVADAIFAPLVARQHMKARQADSRAVSNDTLVAVSEAYFRVQQARGELAGAIDTSRRTEELVRRTRKLAPAIVPELELFRAETELARRQESDLLARERWKVASSDLVRLLRLDPAAQVQPVEPPHLRVELIDMKRSVDDLIAIGLTHRPELASQQAQIQATLAGLQQERWRPLLPNVLLRGASTNPGGTLAGGGFFPSPTPGISGMRADFDLQILWQLDNLGVGNRAAIHKREAEKRLAVVELSRMQYQVAAEVAREYAQAQQAARRSAAAERGLKSAILSAAKNLEALSQTRGAGNQMVTLVRPQEVVAAIQALSQAYLDYYGAIADANRAQFRLYRALGQPAQTVLPDHETPAQLPDAAPGPLLQPPTPIE